MIVKKFIIHNTHILKQEYLQYGILKNEYERPTPKNYANKIYKKKRNKK